MMGGFGFLWMLVPTLFLIGLIALAIWAITRIFPSEQPPPADSHEASAEETLRQRYARGEIGEDEYERSRKVLRRE